MGFDIFVCLFAGPQVYTFQSRNLFTEEKSLHRQPITDREEAQIYERHKEHFKIGVL